MAQASITAPEPAIRRDAKPAVVTAEKADADKGKPDELQTVIDRLQKSQDLMQGVSKPLAAAIRSLAEPEAAARLGEPAFRTQVAHVLQDVEKLTRHALSMSPSLREEMTALATMSHPRLQNDRMQNLMRLTPGIASRDLVEEIRATAATIGREVNQSSPAAHSLVDALENKLRLAPGRPVDAAAGAASGLTTTQPDAARAPIADPKAADLRTASSPPAGFGMPPPAVSTPAAIEPRDAAQGNGPIFRIVSALQPQPSGPAPWEPALSPLGHQVSRYGQWVQRGRQEEALRQAENAGKIALQAMRDFGSAPGGTVLTRIQDAANASPGGMAAVLTEMKEGGRFADLRREFNAALEAGGRFAAAYDQAAHAIDRYGGARAAAEQIAVRRTDYTHIKARFDKLDAELGKESAQTPGRTEGNSLLDEAGKKAAEIMTKAVDAVRRAAERIMTPAASPAPEP